MGYEHSERSALGLASVGTLAVIVMAVGLTTACAEEGPVVAPPDQGPRDVVQSANRVYGDEVEFGDGVLRTWAEMEGGTPVAIGLSFTEEALDAETFSNHVVPFPATGTLWDHLGLDWNPAGHPPPGVYDLPHFDVHFYMLDEAALGAIPGGSDPVTPEDRYIPDGYGTDGMSVPAMGVHWVDLGGPEFSGQVFTYTMVYGFADGEMVFLEPMITLDFLESRTSVSKPVAEAEEVQRTGYYPAGFTIAYDDANRQFDIYLSDFTLRQAS